MQRDSIKIYAKIKGFKRGWWKSKHYNSDFIILWRLYLSDIYLSVLFKLCRLTKVNLISNQLDYELKGNPFLAQ